MPTTPTTRERSATDGSPWGLHAGGEAARRQGALIPRVGGVLLLTTVLALAGCLPTAPLITPEGRYGYSIDCSTEIFSWAGCFDKAGQLCGAAGFTIVNQPDCASTRRTLVVACKGPCPQDVPGVVCPGAPR